MEISFKLDFRPKWIILLVNLLSLNWCSLLTICSINTDCCMWHRLYYMHGKANIFLLNYRDLQAAVIGWSQAGCNDYQLSCETVQEMFREKLGDTFEGQLVQQVSRFWDTSWWFFFFFVFWIFSNPKAYYIPPILIMVKYLFQKKPLLCVWLIVHRI